ncbi:penicillin-binding transpeptidase domain-containing protein [Chondromyces apiculatus]|uniref:Cell division protein FtsI/Peptidoglycan synthetase n=1 Tax=Chondromyces apiculatus DSM 436 TaxID=1192034 RepID=A0A017TBL9_9BACT|nr:penicillin-binding transpeptidase domain-containing protein [Chondromyces apiculatus]EYF06678.1 Cell division protein FtsI/Peptidoglycan synthetase [Chondromyces apiculatus DSM 436]
MRQWIAIGAAVGLVAVTLPMLRGQDEKLSALLSKGQLPGSPTITREVTPPPLTDLDLTRIDDRKEVATAPAHGQRNAELTVVPKYQRAALGFMRAGRVPEGAVVMTDVKTGSVLAWASYVDEGRLHDVASEATAPSASVFKVVTGSALIEAGLTPNTKQCYSGGEHSIRAADMVDNKRRDKYCATLSQAMGRSINTVFARLAARNLDQPKLVNMAERLGWGDDVPFDVPITPSKITMPEDELGFARTAAGFWNTTLSPFQAVNLATTVANGGEMIRLHVVNSVKDEEGEIYRGPSERQVIRRAMSEETARAVTSMMEDTVDNGTSYRSFHDKSGRPYLPDIRVAGKTGTLTKPTPEGPYYTWFVGFAPSRKPEVAISVLVANGAKWRVKATNVACDMLRVYFADKKTPGVSDPNDRTNATARR